MPVVADLLFRIGVGLVRMDRGVRAAGLALVVLQSGFPAHAARVSTAGRQPGAVRTVVYRRLPGTGNPGAGGLYPAATDEEFSSAVCHLLPAAGRVDGRSEEHTSELQSPCNLVC